MTLVVLKGFEAICAPSPFIGDDLSMNGKMANGDAGLTGDDSGSLREMRINCCSDGD